MPEQLTLTDESNEYRAFVDKFRPKRTTDDCCMPQPIYDAVADWVAARYGLDRARFVRPFWPRGDYEREECPDGCCVVDSPPLSILSRIVDFYQARGVPFSLLAPALTILGSRKRLMELNRIVCDSCVTYGNGAVVRTGFVTNLDTDGTVLEADPALGDAINLADRELRAATRRRVPKYEYPDHVITAAKAQRFAAHRTPYGLNARGCVPIAKLDAMGGKGIFGGGPLLSERAAAERAAARRWQLSEREREMVAMLGWPPASPTAPTTPETSRCPRGRP